MRASLAVMVKSRSASSGLKVAPSPMGCEKAGGVERGVAVEALFMDDDRDAEAGVLDEELLDGIRQLGGSTRPQTFAGLAGTADLAESTTIFEGLTGFSKVERTVRVDQCVGPFAPDAHHLGGLLFQGHSGK